LASEETGTERISHTGRVGLALLFRNANENGVAAAPLDASAIGAKGDDANIHHGGEVSGRPAGLLFDQRRLVLVREQVLRSLDQGLDVVTVHPGELLGRVSGEGIPAEAAFVGVTAHSLRIVRPDQHHIRAPDLIDDGFQLDVARFGHGTGIERRDLVLLGVRRAHEPCRVVRVRHVHTARIDAMTLQPRLVVGEVRTDGTDEYRAETQAPHTEGDVGRDATSSDLQFLHEERQRDFVDLVGHQRVRELPGEAHQVVGCNGSGDQNGHEHGPYL